MDHIVTECLVKCSGSDNVTNTVAGKRASSTSSPLLAAERLAEKLYPGRVVDVTEIEHGNRYVRKFSITAREGAVQSERRAMKTMTLDEFHATLKAQGVNSHIHFAFRCPMCATVQSAADLIAAGAGTDFEAVEKYLGFSCVGRFTGAGSPRKKPDGQACNWTLGGLFALHKLEVVTPNGEQHPRFEPATPAEAQEHKASLLARAA